VDSQVTKPVVPQSWRMQTIAYASFLLYTLSMLLTDLLSGYKPVYPESHLWPDTFAIFETNANDKEIIRDLLEELARDGDFREPIILSTVEEHDFTPDEDGEVHPYDPYIQNGTHRVYASYLAGRKEVTVQEGWLPDLPEETSEEEYSLYPATMTIIKMNESVEDELFWSLVDNIISFRVSPDLWLNSDVQGSQADVITVTWSHVELDELKRTTINTAVIDRVAHHLGSKNFVAKTFTFFTESEEDWYYKESRTW